MVSNSSNKIHQTWPNPLSDALYLSRASLQVTPSIHANGLPDVFSRPGSRTNVAANMVNSSSAISVDPMPDTGGNGGIGGGANSFYSSANGHCGSVSSLRSGVSERSQVSNFSPSKFVSSMHIQSVT